MLDYCIKEITKRGLFCNIGSYHNVINHYIPSSLSYTTTTIKEQDDQADLIFYSQIYNNDYINKIIKIQKIYTL